MMWNKALWRVLEDAKSDEIVTVLEELHTTGEAKTLSPVWVYCLPETPGSYTTSELRHVSREMQETYTWVPAFPEWLTIRRTSSLRYSSEKSSEGTSGFVHRVPRGQDMSSFHANAKIVSTTKDVGHPFQSCLFLSLRLSSGELMYP